MKLSELSEFSPETNECLMVMTMLLKNSLEELNTNLSNINNNLTKINSKLSNIDSGVRLLCTK